MEYPKCRNCGTRLVTNMERYGYNYLCKDCHEKQLSPLAKVENWIYNKFKKKEKKK